MVELFFLHLPALSSSSLPFRPKLNLSSLFTWANWCTVNSICASICCQQLPSLYHQSELTQCYYQSTVNEIHKDLMWMNEMHRFMSIIHQICSTKNGTSIHMRNCIQKKSMQKCVKLINLAKANLKQFNLARWSWIEFENLGQSVPKSM